MRVGVEAGGLIAFPVVRAAQRVSQGRFLFHRSLSSVLFPGPRRHGRFAGPGRCPWASTPSRFAASRTPCPAKGHTPLSPLLPLPISIIPRTGKCWPPVKLVRQLAPLRVVTVGHRPETRPRGMRLTAYLDDGGVDLVPFGMQDVACRLFEHSGDDRAGHAVIGEVGRNRPGVVSIHRGRVSPSRRGRWAGRACRRGLWRLCAPG